MAIPCLFTLVGLYMGSDSSKSNIVLKLHVVNCVLDWYWNKFLTKKHIAGVMDNSPPYFECMCRGNNMMSCQTMMS